MPVTRKQNGIVKHKSRLSHAEIEREAQAIFDLAVAAVAELEEEEKEEGEKKKRKGTKSPVARKLRPAPRRLQRMRFQTAVSRWKLTYVQVQRQYQHLRHKHLRHQHHRYLRPCPYPSQHHKHRHQQQTTLHG